ncbi:helix-turn-helix domain-containing protein [Streptomyces sp. NPDC051985]|uniref:helix-turn-helix domain-containing protein n=1 Tax=Streptomyces sp. NPDC051985 TaxID=3155807 RepID=UPI003434D53B
MLRGHRRAARLTLEQLAEASGVSARTLSDIERGRSRGPQHRTVTALADALALDGDTRTRFLELARDGRLEDHWSRPASGLHELPCGVADFTGRSRELIWMSDLVYTESAPGVGVVGLITGSAGLGKTTLAVRAARTLLPSFPDGAVLLDLFGLSPHPLPVPDALRALLRALGVPDQRIPPGAQERAALYRSLMRDRRMLIVLDNAGSEEQVRPLLPGGGASRVLVTTRRLLTGLEGVRRLALGPLQLTESIRLLAGILNGRPVDDTALTHLADMCGGLPLALRIIGNRLLSRPDWDAAELAARLAPEEHRLDQFKAGDLRIAVAFTMSYDHLAPSAQQVFRRLAAVPGRDFDAALASVAGGLPLGDAWEALDGLVDLGLLQDAAAGRYRFHDLVRLFARDRLQTEEGDDAPAVRERVTAWLLWAATAAGRWFEPGYGRPDPDFPALGSPEDAEDWLRANVENWLGALRSGTAAGRHSLVLDCAESMHWFSDRWTHAPPHWREVFGLGAQAAVALADPAQQATQLNYLAWVHWVPPGDPEAMLRCTAQALDLAERCGATAQVAAAHDYTSRALLALERPDEAASFAAVAAGMFQAVGDIDAYVQVLSQIGHCRRKEGRLTEALHQYRTALELIDDERSGMTPTIASQCRPYALMRIGQCLAGLDRRAEAVTALTEAVNLMDALQPNFRQAEALETLGALLDDDGRLYYERAARTYRQIGDEAAGLRCEAAI